MNLPLLQYRIRIGGIPWLVKTALGVVRSPLKPAESASPAFDLGTERSDAPRILYIHSGWAIETVGRLWFTGQTLGQVTFVRSGNPLLTAEHMNQFDLVWYGYSSLYRQHPCVPSKAVLAVHDPAELFPERADWKTSCSIPADKVGQLRKARAVVAISREMQEVLERAGVKAYRIPTCSRVEARAEADILPHDKPSMLAVGRIYRRKNFEQFKRISRIAAQKHGIRSRLKGDHFPISEERYLELLDRHPIYVCTSFQEGGPLPVMDAMRRGAVVLSSRVGQVPEFIDHGVNGFICDNDGEFLEAIHLLAGDPAKLHEMRIASLHAILKKRDEAGIREAADAAIRSILETSH